METNTTPQLKRPFRVHAIDAEPGWLLEVIKAHEQALERGKDVLKNEHKTSIARVMCAGRPAVVKHYRYMGLRFLLKGLLRPHPAKRSLAAALAMCQRSMPTPKVLGLIERRCCGLPAECWLVTEDLPEVVEMDRYILRNFPRGCDRQRRRRFVTAFALQLQTLMRSGIQHRDLKTCNVLVMEEADTWKFAFIDLDDVAVVHEHALASREDWILALAQLNPSTPKILPWTDRLRFLEHLEDLRAFERKPLIARIQEISRRRRRAYFSDEGTVEIDFE